ncbi:hypothetical protein D3C72_2183710 [compost metagenome]
MASAEAGYPFEDGAANLFGDPRVDGGFKNDDVAGFQSLTNRFRCHDERREVRAIVLIDRGWNGDNEKRGALQILRT